MTISMTGYGRGEYLDERYHFTVEAKSVNNRYLDIQVKMPSGETADLNKHDAVMLRMGVQVALGFFEKLPIKLKGALPEVSCE